MSMFLRMVPSFLPFFEQNKNTAMNNCKQDFEVALIEYKVSVNVRDCTILRCCAFNMPPDEH